MWHCALCMLNAALTSVWVKPKTEAIQIKVTEQYFHHVILFIMLYKVVLTFQSVGETLVCDHSNESC